MAFNPSTPADIIDFVRAERQPYEGDLQPGEGKAIDKEMVALGGLLAPTISPEDVPKVLELFRGVGESQYALANEKQAQRLSEKRVADAVKGLPLLSAVGGTITPEQKRFAKLSPDERNTARIAYAKKISQDPALRVGTLASDLQGRVARGEITQETATQISSQVEADITQMAERFKTEVANGTRTMADVRTELAGITDPTRKKILEQRLGPELSGGKMADAVQGLSDITINEAASLSAFRVHRLKRGMEELLSAPDIDKLPPAIQGVFKEAVAHQLGRLEGIDNLSQLEENKFQAEINTLNLERRQAEWTRTFARIRRFAVPAGIVLALGIGGGSIAALSGMNIYASIAIGSGLSLAGAGTAYGLSRIRVTGADVRISKLQEEIEAKRVEAQRKNIDIHNIRSRRSSLPLQALSEAADLAAEANWVAVGTKSGLPKEEWIKRYKEASGLPELSDLREAITKLSMSS